MHRITARLCRTLSLSLLFVWIAPFSLQAAAVQDVLRTPDAQTVSRGDFIRAAVSTLHIPTDRATAPLTFKRPVPKALQLSIRTAQERGALEVFGKDLQLSRAISRGDALVVLMKLQALKPSGAIQVHFPDVQSGSLTERAVQLATERGWMEPVRSDLFGVARSLTGLEGRLLLRKAAGDGGSGGDGLNVNGKVPSIVIRFKTKEPMPLPQEEMLRTVWQLLNEEYLYKDKIKGDEAAYKGAEAMVGSLGDPYTTFMKPASTQEFQGRLQGQVSGIGAEVDFKDGTLVIISPLPGSPAEKAGLLPGDMILEVDGTPLAGLDFLGAVNKVRGPQGSVVKLTIRRDGNDMTVKVTRDIVKIAEITISMQGTIAVVKLAQFGERTRNDFRSLMTDVQSRHPHGIVLDLRSNPGGLLDAADTVISNFVPQGSTVASINYSDHVTIEKTTDPPTIDPSVPMVVIVNKGSASASEIVAGCLQDSKRATVVGEQSFGKGTVQEIIDFKNGASLKLTIAEWKTPAGHAINKVGITPDVVVKATDSGRDEQMIKALDLLR